MDVAVFDVGWLVVGVLVLWRGMRCIAHWRFTGRFVEPPRSMDRVVAARPYNPDRVLHTVGRWEYLKERLGLGAGPVGLCGYRLYSDAGEAIDKPSLEDAQWCPDCEDCWQGLSRLAK